MGSAMTEPSLRAALPLGADRILLLLAAQDATYRRSWAQLVLLNADPKRGNRAAYIEQVLGKRDPLAFTLLMRSHFDNTDLLAAMAGDRHRHHLDACVLWRETFGPVPHNAHGVLALEERLPDDATFLQWLRGGLSIQHSTSAHSKAAQCPHPFGGEPRLLTVEKAWRIVLGLPSPKEARKLRQIAHQRDRGRTKGPKGGTLSPLLPTGTQPI
jgi:hypothetical protein